MMRALRWVVLAVLGLALLTVAMANRTTVTLRALPDDIAAFTGLTWQIDLPLFLVIFAGIAGGLLIGFVWEWLREHKHRSVMGQKAREVARLERELAGLRDAKGQPQDDVLALLEPKKG